MNIHYIVILSGDGFFLCWHFDHCRKEIQWFRLIFRYNTWVFIRSKNRNKIMDSHFSFMLWLLISTPVSIYEWIGLWEWMETMRVILHHHNIILKFYTPIFFPWQMEVIWEQHSILYFRELLWRNQTYKHLKLHNTSTKHFRRLVNQPNDSFDYFKRSLIITSFYFIVSTLFEKWVFVWRGRFGGYWWWQRLFYSTFLFVDSFCNA